jgi:hypothetical protein
MPAKTIFNPQKIRRRKRTVGIIAIVLLLLFTLFYFLGDISFIVWVLADLVVAAIANLLFRKVGRIPSTK